MRTLPQPLGSQDSPVRLSPTKRPAWPAPLIAVVAFLISFVAMLFFFQGGVAVDLTTLATWAVMLAFLVMCGLACRYRFRSRLERRFEGDWKYHLIAIVVMSFWFCVLAYFWSFLPNINM